MYIAQQPSSSSPITEFNISSGNSGPEAIISGPNRTFWFTEFNAGKIGEFNAKSSTFKHFTIPEAGARPVTLAMDRLGRIWFTDQNVSSVWLLDPSQGTGGSFHQYLTATPQSTPVFVLIDPINNTWFTDTTANFIGEITYPSGQMMKYPLPNPLSGPGEIALQNGTQYLWITESYSNKIARFDMVNHTFQEFTPSVSLNSPVGIVVDKYGNVWVSEHGGSSIVELSPDSSTFAKYPTSQAAGLAQTAPATLTIDRMGRLWFAEHLANRVGRLDPSTGIMDEFVIPIPGAFSWLNTLDSNDSFWFTEYYANEIGMIPWNASSPVRISPMLIPTGQVTAGQTVSSQVSITNISAHQITLGLNVTSSFASDGLTTSSEVSLSRGSLTLNPGQTANITATITPDFSLSSGVYAVGVVATYGVVSSVGLIFLRVQGSLLFLLETFLPEIFIAAASVLVVTLLLKRRRKNKTASKVISAKPLPRVNSSSIVVLVFILFFVDIAMPANAKCPGFPQQPVNFNGPSGPDYFGIALDVGSIAFFAIVAYLLVKNRFRKSKASPQNDIL